MMQVSIGFLTSHDLPGPDKIPQPSRNIQGTGATGERGAFNTVVMGFRIILPCSQSIGPAFNGIPEFPKESEKIL